MYDSLFFSFKMRKKYGFQIVNSGEKVGMSILGIRDVFQLRLERIGVVFTIPIP